MKGNQTRHLGGDKGELRDTIQGWWEGREDGGKANHVKGKRTDAVSSVFHDLQRYVADSIHAPVRGDQTHLHASQEGRLVLEGGGEDPGWEYG